MSGEMPTVYPRHTKYCPLPTEERIRKNHCGKCPYYLDRFHNGKRIPESLKTKNYPKALIKAQGILDSGMGKSKLLKEAIEEWKKSLTTKNVDSETQKYYLRLIEGTLLPWCEKRNIFGLDKLTLIVLEEFRDGRQNSRTRKPQPLAPTTVRKERNALCLFCDFIYRRGWVKADPTLLMEPVEVPETEKHPYTPSEITRILFAAEAEPIEERRRVVMAMILMMRWHGLRISDVAQLKREEVKTHQLRLYCEKNQTYIFMPLHEDAERALLKIPGNDPFYFWDGQDAIEVRYSQLRQWLTYTYDRSGVEEAKNHRFRCTFISEGLAAGMTERTMSDIVGIDEHTLRKHYGKWMAERQNQITAAVTELFKFAGGRKDQPENVESEIASFSHQLETPKPN